MSSLNGPKKIAVIDRSGMSKMLEATPLHYGEAWSIGDKINLQLESADIKQLLFLGAGGSAVGGNLVKEWAYERVALPIAVINDYSLPKYANKHTLIFGVSYSGETEETLISFLEALRRGCPCIGLSSGGLLEKMCIKYDAPHIKIPSGFQPRVALSYLSIPFFRIIDKLGLATGLKTEFTETVALLRSVCNKIKPSVSIARNQAKQIAMNLIDTFPIIYSFREFATVAYRFKTQLNENSKILAYQGVLPEINHNEIMGWEGMPSDFSSTASVILIRTEDEPKENKARFGITKQLISRKTQVYEIYAEGQGRLAKMFSTIYLCDYISFYLAVLRGIDPTPVKNLLNIKSYLHRKIGMKEYIMKKLVKSPRSL